MWNIKYTTYTSPNLYMTHVCNISINAAHKQHPTTSFRMWCVFDCLRLHPHTQHLECDVKSLIAYVSIHTHNIKNVMWSLWLLTFTSTDGESVIAWCTLVTFLSLHSRSTRTLPGSLVTLGVDRPQIVTLTGGASPPRIQIPGILLKETRNPKWKILMAFATLEWYFDSKK